MGWVYAEGNNASEDDLHDGSVVAVLSDGTHSAPDRWEEHGEAEERGLNWTWSFKYDGREGRRKAQGVRIVCTCGWQGARRPADFDDPDACNKQLQGEFNRHCELSLYTMPTQRLRHQVRDLDEAFGDLTHPGRPRESDSERPLLALHMATSLKDNIEAWQRAGVRSARRHGFSWDEIASALKMTKQSAHEKFKAEDGMLP